MILLIPKLVNSTRNYLTAQLLSPRQLSAPAAGVVDVAMIMLNVPGQNKLVTHFTTMIQSMLKFSIGTIILQFLHTEISTDNARDRVRLAPSQVLKQSGKGSHFSVVSNCIAFRDIQQLSSSCLH